MKKTFYVHIGAHKTGTTAIQNFLLSNISALGKKGWFYERHGPDVVFELKKHSAREIRGNPDSPVLKYFRSIDQSDLPNVILSAEGLEGLTDKGVDRFKTLMEDRYDVKIVYYVRRQDERLEAEYKQRVKSPQINQIWNRTSKQGRLSATFSEFLSDNYEEVIDAVLDYSEIIGRWASFFGKENMIIRVYEKQQMPDGSVKDFIRTLGIPFDDSFRLDEILFNRSFTREETEFIRICNIACKDDHDLHDFIVKSFNRLQLKKGSGSGQGYMTPRERREVISRYEESNARVAREYLHREDGRLFLAPVPSPDEPFVPFTGLTVEDLVPIVTQLLHQVDDRHKHQLAKVKTEIERVSGLKTES